MTIEVSGRKQDITFLRERNFKVEDCDAFYKIKCRKMVGNSSYISQYEMDAVRSLGDIIFIDFDKKEISVRKVA